MEVGKKRITVELTRGETANTTLHFTGQLHKRVAVSPSRPMNCSMRCHFTRAIFSEKEFAPNTKSMTNQKTESIINNQTWMGAKNAEATDTQMERVLANVQNIVNILEPLDYYEKEAVLKMAQQFFGCQEMQKTMAFMNRSSEASHQP